MFEVKGIPLITDEIEILKLLREQVLQRTGKELFHKIKRTGNNIMVCCPHHNNGQEKRPSCGILTKRIGNTAPGTVHCFACGYKDTLEGMISKCFGYSGDDYGVKWLTENFVDDPTYSRPSLLSNIQRNTQKNTVKYITEEELSKYRYFHPYMFKRKLTKEVIEKYDVGYQKDFIVYKDKITGYTINDEVVTFPVKDLKGNCLFVSRRSITGKTFYLPEEMEKPVYGIYELPKGCKQVIICESVFNALTCVVYGRSAVALFGTGTPYQIDILNKLPVRKYILALDPDEAGEKGTQRLKRGLKNKLLGKLLIPRGKDVNDLSYDEFRNLPEIMI